MRESFPDPRRGRTLVLCPIGLGNFLMATPALKVLSRELPGRPAFLALKNGIAEMARNSGLFSRVFAWDPDRESLLKGLRLLAEIRGERFSHSLALFPSSHWKFTAFHLLAGAGFRMGFAYPRQKSPEWAQHLSLALEDTHDTFQNLRLVEAFLGAPIANPGEPFFPMAPETPPGLPEGPFFACHPGSSAERGMEEKRLPPASFAHLIRSAHRESGWRCLLVGGPEERELRLAVTRECPEAVIPAEARSLAETAGILRGARFFLGNDSGLMHLSAALGTRCAAFFGPTDEKRTGPFGYWEKISGTPRHLILRRRGTTPLWTLRTVGANPPASFAGGSPWSLDLPEAWTELRAWIAAL